MIEQNQDSYLLEYPLKFPLDLFACFSLYLRISSFRLSCSEILKLDSSVVTAISSLSVSVL